MSIDEPIGTAQQQSNVNSNNNRASTEPGNNTEQQSISSLSDSNIKSVESGGAASATGPATTSVALPDACNNNNLSDPAQGPGATVSADAPPPAKTAPLGENLIQQHVTAETFNEKKRKLTLSLPLGGGVGSSPSSELSSISSTDSNKPLNQTVDQLKITNSTTNGDLVKHLGNHNISTPQIDKILLDLIPTNHIGMKTPGSATLAFLTPNGSLSYNNILQSQFSCPGANIFDISQFKTPSEENAMNITLAQQGAPQNANSFNNNNNTNPNINSNSNNNNSQFRRQNSDLNHYVNPNDIFVNNDTSNQITNNANIPKYTTLSNVSVMNGNTQNPLILPSDNTTKLVNTNNLTGNYVQQQQHAHTNQHQSININKPNEQQINDQSQQGANNFNTSMLNNSTSKILNRIKDEFHTVPEHPSTLKPAKPVQQIKRKANNNNTMNNNKQLKTDKSLSSGSTDSSVDSLNNNNINSASIIERRDTGNSSVDSLSNNEAYSPINLDNQARMKIEIKRERNREAARKCRTRKLEKIATLEIQVKALSDANEMEKAKNETLAEEINKIRQKLEMHKKIHNCDLKMM